MRRIALRGEVVAVIYRNPLEITTNPPHRRLPYRIRTSRSAGRILHPKGGLSKSLKGKKADRNALETTGSAGRESSTLLRWKTGFETAHLLTLE